MPTYQFACRSCGREFETFLLRTITDEDRVCPNCGSREVDRRYDEFYGYGAPGHSESCGWTGGFG